MPIMCNTGIFVPLISFPLVLFCIGSLLKSVQQINCINNFELGVDISIFFVIGSEEKKFPQKCPTNHRKRFLSGTSYKPVFRTGSVTYSIKYYIERIDSKTTDILHQAKLMKALPNTIHSIWIICRLFFSPYISLTARY
jgi:hypothetical protein